MLSEQKTRSFWERPEGTTGKIFLVAILAMLGLGFFHFLPMMLVLAQNTLYLGFLVAGIGSLTYIALDKNMHNLIGYAYKGLMRGITRSFIQIDPIAIIETYIRGMKNNLLMMDKQGCRLREEMRKLQNVITKNEADRLQNMKLAHAAKSQGADEALVTIKARKVGRLKETNITLQALYSKMELLYRVLDKMQTNASYMIEDIEDEVDVKKRERNALMAGQNAFRSAMKIIKGDPDQKYMFDQAMEFMVDDIGSKLGEMEHFMEVSSTFMQSVDLQNGVLKEEGLQQLEDWANSGASLMLGNDKTVLIDRANNSKEVLDLDAPASTAKRPDNKYSALLK